MGLSIASVYSIFFLSGAAALIYEVLWVRYLSLVFGGSHLAVTTVLAVFMGGLALGSYLIGKRVGTAGKLLRLYGYLELGIALSALIFMGLIHYYPQIYIPLAQINETSPLYLSVVRICLATMALILPTTLMGGTLPVLSAFISQHMKGIGHRLSFLYGINTIGAVVGAAVTGFYFLVYFSVNTTLLIPIVVNVAVGLTAIVLQARISRLPVAEETMAAEEPAPAPETDKAYLTESDAASLGSSFNFVLWGIGVSGFCALGYEVLWTRILSIVIGATTYGFTILLMAFLAGIGLGSSALGLYGKLFRSTGDVTALRARKLILIFGLVQIAIGATALLVSLHIRELPTHAEYISDIIHSLKFRIQPFKTKQLSHFITAFSFMLVPAFFMGVAFPLAGKIHSLRKKDMGKVVGDVLSFNTIGAILGSAVSGFVLIYFFGIQRSLQILILINIGFGLLVMVSLRGSRVLNWVVALAVTAAIMVPVSFSHLWQIWNPQMYAVYQSNNPQMFSTPEKTREVLNNNDIKYYAEGTNSIISVVQSSDALFFITNGRVEASNAGPDKQCQYTLGHLPMLLHPNPKKVFVLGTGSGMTLGATSVHPSVEQITLAEIEPKVLGVARAFGIYNHYVLNINKPNPKLKIVFNDGRNYLMTTRDKFDVITADPVHPWFSGAGYLYTAEYFKLAAEHLNPGGIICQWLPLYELSEENLQSVVKTLRQNFKYTMIWLTHGDAELIGSNSPIIIDENELAKRIREPEVLRDLEQVDMGSAEDFLSYFLMGSNGTKSYSDRAIVNTDNNLYLEFSAPRSMGKTKVLATNVSGLIDHRENILPYLRAPGNDKEKMQQRTRWGLNRKAAAMYDEAHVLYLEGRRKTEEYRELMSKLESEYPWYAPTSFLRGEEGAGAVKFVGQPTLLKEIVLDFVSKKGKVARLQFSAVLLRRNSERSRVFFVDNTSHFVFGKLRVKGANKDALVAGFVDDLLKEVQKLYAQQQSQAIARGGRLPKETTLFPEINRVVEQKIDQWPPK
ncbi:MAG: spermidine synthase [Geobacter sp.]|nr:MAG: spermidine synthase [Geobacter sp.]